MENIMTILPGHAELQTAVKDFSLAVALTLGATVGFFFLMDAAVRLLGV
jgi:hypothetical protein